MTANRPVAGSYLRCHILQLHIKILTSPAHRLLHGSDFHARRLEKLKEDLEKMGVLRVQIKKLEETGRALGEKTDWPTRLENELRDEASAISTLSDMLRSRRTFMPCRFCGLHLQITLEAKEQYDDVIRNQLVILVPCPRRHNTSCSIH